MRANPQQIIFEILTIIGYAGDKDFFSKRFVKLILDQALLLVVDGLPALQKVRLKNDMAKVYDFKNAAKILTRFISLPAFESAVIKTTERLMKDYLAAVIPTLRPRQKLALETYLVKLRKTVKTS